jgi:hypothetical protein
VKIRENENELIIEETPGCLWFFGLFFALVGGVFVYGSLGGFTNRDEVSPAAFYLSFLMGAIAVVVGIWIIYRAPVTKVVVNRQTKKLIHTRYGLAGKQKNLYDFRQVKQFCLIEEVDDESNPIWSLGLKLSNGETIVISSLQSHNEKYKRDFVFRTNEFMHKQIASSQMIFEIEDKNELKSN